MRKRSKRLFSTLIALMLFIGCAAPAAALKSVEIRTVRVGFYHTVGFNEIDENGEKSGYGYEVLQAMKLYNNWKYEYVGYDLGWADMQVMLNTGEIDMVITAVKTPERELEYDFSERPVSQSGACLMVKAGESPYVAGQYDSYNGIRIGFLQNAVHIASTEAFAKEKGFTYIPVYYKTSAELEKAILDGTDIDAIATSNMRIILGTRRLDLYAMQDVHAMVRKGNTELLAEINHALEQISLYQPNLYESLYNKYYSVDEGDRVFFSPDEIRFQEECEENGVVLTAALSPDIQPYAYYENGEPTGILYDITSEIIRRTGLKTELIKAENKAEYSELVNNRGVDVQLSALFDYNEAEKQGYVQISPYFSTDISRVMRKDNTAPIRSVAVVRRSIIESKYLPEIITNETVVSYDTVDECVDAVLARRCDALYLYTRTAQEAVYNEETNSLKSVIMPKHNVSFTISIREDADARLATMLEKASKSLGDDEISAMVLKYTDYKGGSQALSLRGILYSNPILVVTLLMLLMSLIFTAVMLALIASRRRLEREKSNELTEALALAEQANSAKSAFMSRMSHEIRTPLNAIIGYNSISCDKLAEAHSESEFRDAAMKAMDCLSKSDMASKHLLSVINDVLDMSAIESGKFIIASEPFDFRGMISALTVMFYTQSKSKNVDMEVVFENPTEEWFIGDQTRVHQILTNLMSNAVKFTPEGGSIRLGISQENIDDSSARIRFVLSDTGIGMSREFLKNIWMPFEQADATISRRFGGTGLGLSITKNLVDLMGGEISVESELSVGTTFHVQLTLKRMSQPTKEFVMSFASQNVLVADDDDSTRDYLRLLFERSGARCTLVSNGDEAVYAVKRGIELGDSYTVCVIDWQMPTGDGISTVKRIRQISGANMPIIILSAYDFSEVEASAKEAGVQSFLSKPLFQSTVFDLLANIGGQRRASTDVPSDRLNFGGARILLAEDNPMNMEVAKETLRNWNLTVDQAWNGQEAVDMFCSAPSGTYKLILMDVHMPEMDGYQATRVIRSSSNSDASTVPIIAMTADVFAEDVAAATLAGMNAHIGKPIERNMLLEILTSYMVRD